MRLSNLLLFVGLIAGCSIPARANYYTLPGALPYSTLAGRKTFDINNAGNIAVVVSANPDFPHNVFLTSFDPTSGTELDAESLDAFGPLEVVLTETPNGLRAVVLTSEGGRKIRVFGVSSSGALSPLGSSQLTTAGSDYGSNVVLSGSAQAGFVIVRDPAANAPQFVSFGLNDGAIIARLRILPVAPPLFGSLGMYNQTILALAETPTKRTVAFLQHFNTVGGINVTNIEQPIDTGGIPLPSIDPLLGVDAEGIASSADGRYVFVASPYSSVVVIDLVAMQAISSVVQNYRFGRIRIYEHNNQRLLAVGGSTTFNSGADHGVLALVDVTNPLQPFMSNHLDFVGYSFSYRSDFDFAKQGSQLATQTTRGLLALDVPALTTAWEEIPPTNPSYILQPVQLMIYQGPERILMAWNSGNDFFLSRSVDKRRQGQLISQ